jgi:TolB-like protein/class 3 adenylate cyclase
MATEGFKRKLAAIFSADVAGYSRLMGQAEAATVETITAYRGVMSELIKQHRGRVIDSPGDNLLAEFSSVVDAMQCALAVQKELQARNAGLPEDRRMQFRLGINLGDVIEEEGRIYGDGVNIAARLEALASPGGICISKTAFEHIESKLPLGYEYLGEQTVKNIPKPVGAYRVLMDPRVTVAEKPETKSVPVRRMPVFIGAAAVLALALATGVWYFYLRPAQPPIETASVEEMAFPLPDKPSIAVLPFANLSHDPEQEYFADGMTDDLITDLSKISGLFVIARNSAFTYKDKPVKVRQVAEELGVRYVLEGSVRKAGNRVRINAQLIDATTGGHLWAERYDSEMGDLLTLQDRITGKIVAALAVKLTAGEQEQIARKFTDNVAAYDAFLQGRAHYVLRTPEDFARAVHYFEKAIELDPNYGRAYAALALTYWECSLNLWAEKSLGLSLWDARTQAKRYLQTAMNNPTSLVYQVVSKMHTDSREHEEAIDKAQHAIALDPNDANSYLAMAYALIYAGRPKEALDFVEKAMRLDPHYPAYYLFVLGLAHFGMEQFKEGANSFERGLRRNPENYMPLINLAAAYGHLGRKQEATAAIEEFNKVARYTLTVENVGTIGGAYMISKYKNAVDKDRFLDGLRKAGLPETPASICCKILAWGISTKKPVFRVG